MVAQFRLLAMRTGQSVYYWRDDDGITSLRERDVRVPGSKRVTDALRYILQSMQFGIYLFTDYEEHLRAPNIGLLRQIARIQLRQRTQSRVHRRTCVILPEGLDVADRTHRTHARIRRQAAPARWALGDLMATRKAGARSSSSPPQRDDRRVLFDTLDAQNFDAIYTAKDVPQAMSFLQQDPQIDLVVLEFLGDAQRIASPSARSCKGDPRHAEVPVIGIAAAEMAQRTWDWSHVPPGVVDWLRSPVESSEVIGRMSAVLAARRRKRPRRSRRTARLREKYHFRVREQPRRDSPSPIRKAAPSSTPTRRSSSAPVFRARN